MAELIPPRRGEFLTKDGQPTQRFIEWIESLTRSNNEVTTEIINTNIRESFPWPIGLQAGDIEKRFNFPQVIEVKQFRAVTVTANHTASNHEFINAKFNSTITFPLYPQESDIIVIRNADGSDISLIGNGRNINGSSTGALSRQGTSIEFYYFLDSDEWFAK